MEQPFARGSVSTSLYTHGLPAREAASLLVEQAILAEEAGFDGVTISEHHAGVFEYVPNPLMVVTWILAATKRIWAAPCPMLLSIRNPLLAAEEIAWLAARFPGRVGAGVGPGSPSTPDDYAVGRIAYNDRRRLFAANLPVLVDALSGRARAPLDKDPAIAACLEHPIPCMSTVGGPVGARRAANLGIGLVPSSADNNRAIRSYVRSYRDAGGKAAIMCNRRAWFGPADPRRIQSLAAKVAARPIGETQDDRPDFVSSEDPRVVADELARVVADAGGDAVNIKFFYPDLKPDEMARQFEAFGKNVMPLLKPRMAELKMPR